MKLLAKDYPTLGEMVDAAFNAMCKQQASRFYLYYLESTDTAAGEIALADGHDSMHDSPETANFKVADTLPVCTGGKTKDQMRAIIWEKMQKLPILGPRKAAG